MEIINAVLLACPGVRFIMTTEVPYTLIRGNNVLLICDRRERLLEKVNTIASKTEAVLRSLSRPEMLSVVMPSMILRVHCNDAMLYPLSFTDIEQQPHKIRGLNLKYACIVRSHTQRRGED